MADPTGESKGEALRLDFDRRLMLRFRGSVITSNGGLLPYRELDDVLALTTTGRKRLADARTGKNGRHQVVGRCQINLSGPRGARSGMRDHAAATAFRHSLAASALKIRNVDRETRWRWRLKVLWTAACTLRKRWADRADLKRCILRSRRRTG